MSLDNIDDLYKELDDIKEPKPPKRVIIESGKKDEIVSTPTTRTVRIKTFKVPDFNAFLKFCERNLDDYEVEQFYKHTIPRRLHKEKYEHDRGGGGWSGAVKATINIMRKMKEKGVL